MSYCHIGYVALSQTFFFLDNKFHKKDIIILAENKYSVISYSKDSEYAVVAVQTV